MLDRSRWQQAYGDLATRFQFGFSPSAEVWNGRLAMIGFASAIAIEGLTDQGLLHFWGLL
ncbi:MAG: chlorophyll A-B binding protein [Cyanobacteria bacterium QS_8_64_29]|nr:MAG: chlorophyll A-B binding protein [Cyanobacteria bacterium QS_8_64_29]